MIYFTLTIDVEPDCTPNWRYSDPLSFDGIRIGIKERLQPLCAKYKIVPTYLINNVVLEDRESIDIFNGLGGDFELGTHLHPEFIEPGKSVFDYAGSRGEANCCFYPPDIEFKKIENITRLFEKQFGYNPTSFRAGRFSAKDNTLRSLTELGYKVDTSVTPHVCWDDETRERPVDHSSACEQPYWVNDKLLEVPVSIIKKRFNKTLWLRPTFSSGRQLLKVFDTLSGSKKGGEDTVLNMMFHNVEVMPFLSPYIKTDADCERYLSTLERFFILCGERNVASTKLSSLHDIVKPT